MRNFETIEDVIFFAIESEIQSVEFYNRLASAASAEAIKSLFSELMEEEKGHIVKLQYILDHHVELGYPVLNHRFSEEDYLPHVIPSPDVDVKEGLIIAIQKEKSAIRLYNDLAEETQKQEFNKIFLLLASEEAKHCLKFESQYNALMTNH
jgi:rubrerythrin